MNIMPLEGTPNCVIFNFLVIFLVVKWLGYEADHTSQSSDEVKNA
jgi:hypothetical protein